MTKNPAEEVADIIARLSAEFGYNYVDFYVPDGEDLVAFTVSKSREYVEAVSKVGEKGTYH